MTWRLLCFRIYDRCAGGDELVFKQEKLLGFFSLKIEEENDVAKNAQEDGTKKCSQPQRVAHHG